MIPTEDWGYFPYYWFGLGVAIGLCLSQVRRFIKALTEAEVESY